MIFRVGRIVTGALAFAAGLQGNEPILVAVGAALLVLPPSVRPKVRTDPDTPRERYARGEIGAAELEGLIEGEIGITSEGRRSRHPSARASDDRPPSTSA
jgi:hypothetical protein